jgi:hypothetical protein
LLEPHAADTPRPLRCRNLRSDLIGDDPAEMWTYNFLRTKHFHGVSSASPHVYSLKSRYGKVSIFFIPRADFLWFFKYFIGKEPSDRTIELKKRSAEKAKTEIEIATIQIRKFYTVEQGAADIIYTRKASESAKEAFILKNTKEAVKHVAQLLVDFHNDKVMSHPY